MPLVIAVIPLFSFMIWLIWVVSLLLLVILNKVLSIFLIFSNNQTFVSLIFLLLFLFLFYWMSVLSLIIFYCLRFLCVLTSFGSRAFRYAVKVIFSISLQRHFVLNFFLCTAFMVSHKFRYTIQIFSLKSRKSFIYFCL